MFSGFLAPLATVIAFALGRGLGTGQVQWARSSAGLLLPALARVVCELYFLSLLARLFSFALGTVEGRQPAVVLGQCRVVAAYVSAGSMLAKFFITISHCPWRDFISLSNGDKETKQRKRLPTICIKCPQRADHCFWFPRSTVLAKPRTLEPLLLANPDIPTLRHQCSRARSVHLWVSSASPAFTV